MNEMKFGLGFARGSVESREDGLGIHLLTCSCDVGSAREPVMLKRETAKVKSEQYILLIYSSGLTRK